MLMSDFVTGCVKAEELEAGFCETARIMAVDFRQFEEGTKGVVFLDIFHGRAVVLNQTNLKMLIGAFGPNSENWAGRDVTVNRTLADFKGKPVPAIRLEAVRRPAVPAPVATPKLEAAPRVGATTFTAGRPGNRGDRRRRCRAMMTTPSAAPTPTT